MGVDRRQLIIGILHKARGTILHKTALETSEWLIKCDQISSASRIHLVAHVICWASGHGGQHASLHAESSPLNVTLAIFVVVACRLAPWHDIVLTKSFEAHATLVHLRVATLRHPTARLPTQLVVWAFWLLGLWLWRAVARISCLEGLCWNYIPLVARVWTVPIHNHLVRPTIIRISHLERHVASREVNCDLTPLAFE